jgi:voltage-gated potassium channel
MNTHHIKVNYHYLLFSLFVSVTAIILLITTTLVKLDSRTLEIFDWVDNAICAIFFIDFLITFFSTGQKLHYFLKWGWLDLLSSIPLLSALRWGRFARILRIIRVLRVFRSTKILINFILQNRAQSALLAASLLTLLTILISAVIILQFENVPTANIKSAEDAIWWSITTITTVGYGDKYPITTEGRVVASILMIMGISLLTLLSGFFAAWFLKGTEETQDNDLQALRQEIAEIKNFIVNSKND